MLTPGSKPQWKLADVSTESQEHELFNSVICEYVDIAGIPVEFYIKKHLNTDPLYGESTLEEMDGPYRTSIIYQIQGENNVLSAFGISSDETIEACYLPKTIFARDVKDDYLPIPGDVIRTLWNDKLYEIVNVSFETKVFQLKKMIMEIILRPYRHNEAISDEFIAGTLSDIGDFPDINLDRTLSMPLSAGSDNDFVQQKEISEQKYTNVDTALYGYDSI